MRKRVHPVKYTLVTFAEIVFLCSFVWKIHWIIIPTKNSFYKLRGIITVTQNDSPLESYLDIRLRSGFNYNLMNTVDSISNQ